MTQCLGFTKMFENVLIWYRRFCLATDMHIRSSFIGKPFPFPSHLLSQWAEASSQYLTAMGKTCVPKKLAAPRKKATGIRKTSAMLKKKPNITPVTEREAEVMKKPPQRRPWSWEDW